MVDAQKCIELLIHFVELREKISDNYAHYHRLISRAERFGETLEKVKSGSLSVDKSYLNSLEETLSAIKELGKKFKTNYFCYLKQGIFPNAHASEVNDLNGRLAACACDLNVALSIDDKERYRQDQEDLQVFLSGFLKAVQEDYNVTKMDLATLRNKIESNRRAASDDNGEAQSRFRDLQQQLEANRLEADTKFHNLMTSLQQTGQDLSSGLKEHSQEVSSSVQSLMEKIGSMHTELLSQEIKDGISATHEDVKKNGEKLDMVQETMENLLKHFYDGLPTNKATKTLKEGILKGLDKTHDRHKFQLDEDKEIGSGSFGTVLVGRYDGQTVAVKKVQVSTAKKLAAFEAEVIMMDLAKGIPCLTCHGFITDGDGVYRNILLDLVPFGSLSSILYEPIRFPYLLPSLLLAWGGDMARALCHIHRLKIKHRDIKAENFLVDIFLNLKLCDFGFAKKHEETNAMSSSLTGTAVFAAPEIVNFEGSGFYSDIYAWGITILQILTRDRPDQYTASYIDQVTKAVKALQPRLPELFEDRLINLLKRCTLKETECRPSADEVCGEMEGILQGCGGDPRGESEECIKNIKDGAWYRYQGVRRIYLY